jgi:3-mercaptopyruvate sulfurtransferase SseA
MSDYAHPQVLVSTEWLAGHLADPNVRVVEVDVDTAAYDAGHVPGAVAWSWKTDLSDSVRREIQPHLVRPEVSAGVSQRRKLRRVLDRMGNLVGAAVERSVRSAVA